MSDKCPKCGAEYPGEWARAKKYRNATFECGSHLWLTDPPAGEPKFQESWDCLRRQLAQRDAEISRLNARDGNASIALCYDGGPDDPFARETLKHIDFGVADNCYCVESKLVEKLQSENARLTKTVSTIKHCDLCGGSWVDDGINSGCTCETIKGLRAIVDKLPKTADGVPVYCGMNLFAFDGVSGIIVVCGAISMSEGSEPLYYGTLIVRDDEGNEWTVDAADVYSTREAAQAAKEQR